MRSLHFSKRVIPLAAVTLLLSLGTFAGPAFSQSMSFSVYTDAGVDGSGVITMWSSAEDDSWGCTHSAYSTTAHIISPTGRTASATYGGLEASTSLGIGGDFGYYNLYSTGSYYCSCYMGWAGYGGGMMGLASHFTVWAQHGYRSEMINPFNQTKECWYATCPPEPACGSWGFRDIRGIPDPCPAGIESVWWASRFLGITYWCEQISHVDLPYNPCP